MPEKLTVLYIPHNIGQRCELVTIDRGVENMASLIGCHYVDAVTCGIRGLDIWIDDEGLLYERPHNYRASALTRDNITLVGNAFLAGFDDEGNTVSVDKNDKDNTALNLLQKFDENMSNIYHGNWEKVTNE